MKVLTPHACMKSIKYINVQGEYKHRRTTRYRTMVVKEFATNTCGIININHCNKLNEDHHALYTVFKY